jgi:hypothetical protein
MTVPTMIFEPALRNQYDGSVGSTSQFDSIGSDIQTSLQDNESRKAQYTRFMRGQEISLIAKGLCPDKTANIFFDKVNVNRFTQKANKLTVTGMPVPFYQDEEIINATTNAYAKVLTSSNNFVYLNENFINVNVAPYAANTLSTSTLLEDDVIFQTSSNNISGPITFAGTVERYERTSSSHAYLVIKPIDGSFRKFSANSVIFVKDNSTLRLNISATQTVSNNFPVGSTIYSKRDVTKTATVSSHNHYSGVISYAASNDTNVIYVSGNVAGATGETFRIASGIGTSSERTINSVSANGFMLTLSANVSVSSNSKYSYGTHTVDDFGVLTGMFHIPETSDAYFVAGKRLLTITDAATSDSNEYTMRAFNYYSVVGSQGTMADYARLAYDTIAPSKEVALGTADILKNNRKFFPLSQTFFTPATPNTHSDGISTDLSVLQISGIDLYFAEKPTSGDLQLPVKVTINEVENDLPSTKVLGQSIVDAKDINTSLIPDATQITTATTFRFSPPVIVKPSKEYAITVTTSSPDYALFTAEIGGEILGTTPPRRVSEQPYIGDFFKAQNASNWSPIPNEDLMFRIRYSSWSSSSSNTITFVPENLLSNVNVDSLLINSSDYNFKPTSINYAFKTTTVDGDFDADWINVRPGKFYDFSSDLSTSTKSGNRRRRIVAGNNYSLLVKADLSTTDENIAPAIDIERMSAVATEYIINDAGISASDISFTNLGRHSNAANIVITFSAPNRSDGVTANAYVVALANATSYIANVPQAGVYSSNIAIIVVDEPGSGYYTAPTITISEVGSTDNATAVVAGENGSSGGNCKAKYVTKTITLADGFDAGDIRVYLDCNRPVGTDINVYYKVKSGEDNAPFEDKKWQLMSKLNDNFSRDQNQVIELEYRASLDTNRISYVENGITYPLGGKFKYYAIKIVLTASSASVVPYVANFRAVATPAG